MSGAVNPLREHLCHMCLEGLSSVLFESPTALLIMKEEICCAQAVHLYMFKILKYGIILQDM